MSFGINQAGETTKNQIIDQNDCVKTFTYTLTSGAYRLDSIAYTSASLSKTATKSFTWSDFGLSTQRVATITWSVS